MAHIKKTPHGWQLVATIAHGRRIYFHLGKKVTEAKKKVWLKAYDNTVAAMTLARRISISTKDLKLLVERMTTISSDAQERVVTHGLSIDEKINAADTTQWNSLITEFGNRINPNIRPTQQENNRRYLEIIDEFLKKKNIQFYSDCTNESVASFVDWRRFYRRPRDLRSSNKEVSAESIRKELHIWKRLVDWCVAIKKFPDNRIFYGIEIKSTSQNTKTIAPLSIEEINTVFRVLRLSGNDRLHDLALLAYCTGAECKALKWILANYPNCIDKDTSTLQIFNMQVSGINEGKTLYRARSVSLTPTIEAIFKRGFVLGKYKLYSFIANHLSKGSIRFPFHWTMHQLRHSFATHNMSAGVDIATVSAWCGHKDITTTRNVYGRFAKLGIKTLQTAHEEHLKKYRNGYFSTQWNDGK